MNSDDEVKLAMSKLPKLIDERRDDPKLYSALVETLRVLNSRRMKEEEKEERWSFVGNFILYGILALLVVWAALNWNNEFV